MCKWVTSNDSPRTKGIYQIGSQKIVTYKNLGRSGCETQRDEDRKRPAVSAGIGPGPLQSLCPLHRCSMCFVLRGLSGAWEGGAEKVQRESWADYKPRPLTSFPLLFTLPPVKRDVTTDRQTGRQMDVGTHDEIYVV